MAYTTDMFFAMNVPVAQATPVVPVVNVITQQPQTKVPQFSAAQLETIRPDKWRPIVVFPVFYR